MLHRRGHEDDGSPLAVNVGGSHGVGAGGECYVPLGEMNTVPSSSGKRSFTNEPDLERGSGDTVAAAKDAPDRHERIRKSKNKIREQWDAFRTMSLPFFRESKKGRRLFVVMVILTLLNSAVRVLFSYLMRDFWSALSAKDAGLFYEIMGKFILALLLLAPINVFYRFQRQRLAIVWREWMTDRTLQLYYSNRVYYALERSGQGSNIDNPDQRIAEDVRSFTECSLSLFLTVVTAVIDLVCFSVILFSIMPGLFIAIFLYAGIGTGVTTAIGKRLINLNFERLKKEANFRYSLVRIRDNAESIAFYSGEEIEGKEVSSRFSSVVTNIKEIITVRRNLDFFTTLYSYLTWILPVAVVAPKYFAGEVEMGVVTQSSSAFTHVLDDLSIIIDQFELLSEFSAGIDRLFQFMTAIRDADPDREGGFPIMMLPLTSDVKGDDSRMANESSKEQPEGLNRVTLGSIEIRRMPLMPLSKSLRSHSSSVTEGSNNLAMSTSDLTLTTPDNHRTLLRNLNLTLRWDEKLLIAGSSGVGKSSLLRAIAGLWTTGSGTIVRPCDGDVYFLPQRPYCPLGTLRDQLLYPSIDRVANAEDYPEGHRLSRAHLLRRSMTDDDLLDVLTAVDLADLASRSGDGNPGNGLNAVLDWSNTLSLGEQQRLAFARILVNRPRLIIMDESTSALDMESERRMYLLLRDMGLRNGAGKWSCHDNGEAALTYISVGHRPSLLEYHNTKLVLGGNADCTIETI